METMLFLGIIPLAVSGFCLGMILELVKEYNHPHTSREEHYTTCEPANFMYPRLSFRHFVGDNIQIVPTEAEKITLSPFFIGNSKYPGTNKSSLKSYPRFCSSMYSML